MILYLLRHALIPENELGINGAQTDSLLSKKGEKQARLLVETLSQQVYDTYIVSSLQRTLQTLAPYLATQVNPDVAVDSLVIERDLGRLTNSVKGDGKKESSILESGVSEVKWCPPGGESIADVSLRARTFLTKITTDYENKTVLLCSHRNFIRCLELLILKKPLTVDTYFHESPTIIENVELRRYEIF